MLGPLERLDILIPAVVLLVARYTFLRVRKNLLVAATHSADLAVLGVERLEGKKIQGTAVVIGGSIAGLQAARVCRDHFTRVVVVDAENWLASPEASSTTPWEHKDKRTRVVQYNSIHGFIFPIIASVLRRLYPDADEESQGADTKIINTSGAQYLSGRHLAPPYAEYPEGTPEILIASRRGYESLLRRVTLAKGTYPEVKAITGAVTGFKQDPSQASRVGTVEVRTSEGIVKIEAALVVDCAGQGRTSLKWLERAGYGSVSPPRGQLSLDKLEKTYNQYMQYATFELILPTALEKRVPVPIDIWESLGLFALLPDWDKEHRTLFATRLGGGRVHVCAGIWGYEEELPKSLAELQAFAHSLHTDEPLPSWIFEYLEYLEEAEDRMTLSTVKTVPPMHFQFHLAANLPTDYVAIGDSVMKVNPIYGQGCSKAIFGVLALNTLLHANRDIPSVPGELSFKYFKAHHEKIKGWWAQTKLVDYAFKTTVPEEGETLGQHAWMRAYARKLNQLAPVDPYVGSTLFKVNALLASDTDLFAPKMVAKVLWATLFPRRNEII